MIPCTVYIYTALKNRMVVVKHSTTELSLYIKVKWPLHFLLATVYSICYAVIQVKLRTVRGVPLKLTQSQKT